MSKAKQALAREGIGVADVREMLVVETDHRPGGLVDVMLALAEAERERRPRVHGVGGGKVVIATDDLFDARDALS